MKMIKLFVLLTMALVVNTFADSVNYPLGTSTSTSSLLQAGGKINQGVFVNASTNTATFILYDCPTNVITYTVAAYTNAVQTSGSVVTTYTNILGRTESRTNTVLTTTLTPTSAVTNNYRIIYTGVVPGSATLTYTPSSPLSFGLGLAIKPSITNVSATIDYTPSR